MAQADDTITIVDVGQETRNGGQTVLWRVLLRLPDGSTMLHMFPDEILEWRSAEYGIDPADRDLLLDVVLAEPHLPPIADDHPRLLHNADTIDDARTFHLERVAAVTARHRFAGPGFRRRLFDESPMDPEAIELKRRLVEQGRTQRRQQLAAAGPAQDPRSMRLGRLRDAIASAEGERRPTEGP